MNTKKGDILVCLWREPNNGDFDQMKIGRINSQRTLNYERRTYVPIDEFVFCDKINNEWVVEDNMYTKNIYYDQIECAQKDHDGSYSIHILIPAEEGIKIWDDLKTYLSTNRLDLINDLIKSLIVGIFDEDGRCVL